MTRTLDHIDRRLIAELQADGRKPYSRIASALDVGETWHRLGTSVWSSDPEFDVSEKVPGEGKVVYLSLGSLGAWTSA